MGGLSPSRARLYFLLLELLIFMQSLGISNSGQGGPATGTGIPVVRDLGDRHGDSYGRPGLSHLTIAGAVHHGMKEVEVWLQTFAPGSHTPVHRHNCEEVFLILKGEGTLYMAPTSGSRYPGKPDAFAVHANSTFTIPVNAVHQVWNTNHDDDLQHLAIISRPPIKVFAYGDWFTPHADAIEVFPYHWDAEVKVSAEDKCGEIATGISY